MPRKRPTPVKFEMTLRAQSDLARVALDNHQGLAMIDSAWCQLKDLGSGLDSSILAYLADRAIVKSIRTEAAQMLEARKAKMQKAVAA